MKKSTRTEILNFAMAASLTAIAIMSGESLGKWKMEKQIQNFYPLSARIVTINETAMKLPRKIQTEIFGDLPEQKIMKSMIQLHLL